MRTDTRLLASGMRDYRGGRLRQAERACLEVLRRSPEHPDALHLLARMAADSGHSDAAAALLARAIERRGATVPLCLSLGAALRAAGNFAGSDACFRQAVALDPLSADARFEYGQNLLVRSRIEEAAEAFTEALRLDPRHAPAMTRLAAVLQLLGRDEDALAGFNAALRLSPRDPFALIQRARVLAHLDRMEEAALAYGDALRGQPGLAAAYNEFGVVQRALGRHDAARSSYGRALALDSAYADARWNLALLDLLTARFREGWDGYEWRFRRPGFQLPPDPRWDGSPLDGRAVLLKAEQGFGDAIQFVRYAPLVRDRGAGAVAVDCRPELRDLLRRADGVTSAGPPDFAAGCFHAALMSLPRLFGTTLATIPRAVPYLGVDPARSAEWLARLGPPRSGRLRVGVVWAGSPTHDNDRRRSLPPADLSILADAPGVDWYSLQKGLAAVPPLAPLPRELDDFADTAALLVHLDLVVSVDTAVAHLAGALARPVWTLLPFAPDWRWMLERDDSPWYPTMRLFRQPRRGDWQSVLAAVRKELSRLPFTEPRLVARPSGSGQASTAP